MYQDHPSFKSPPDEAVLWRYFDFTKFVSILDKSALFFARASSLNDPFEGALPTYPNSWVTVLDKDVTDALNSKLTAHRRKMRHFVMVNCWHNNDYESAAMWRLYSRERDGIAIKTDFESFKRCFKGDATVYIGKVNYVDFEQVTIDAVNMFNSFVAKRVEFAHEREVRAVISHVPNRGGSLDFSAIPEDAGTYVDVDLDCLVKEIVVAPYADEWFVDLVQSVTSKYNIGAPVKCSSLSQEPTWALD